MQVVVHRVKVCQALARAQLLGHQLDPELQAGTLEGAFRKCWYFVAIQDIDEMFYKYFKYI